MNLAHREILRDISAIGRLPFDEFMEKALYSPSYGYYAGGAFPGRSGDFFTAADIGPGLACLLARIVAWLVEHWGRKGMALVELGPGSGKMLRDVLVGLKDRYLLDLEMLQVMAVERSPALRREQERNLGEFSGLVSWTELDCLPGLDMPCLVFGNEFVDALPVKRFVFRHGTLFELWVAVEDGRLVLVEMPAPEEYALEVERHGPGLPDGCVFEKVPGLAEMMSHLASCCPDSMLVLVDYGDSQENLFGPHRPMGTVRAYEGHELVDPLGSPGTRDITASVNFTELARLAAGAGWRNPVFLPLPEAALAMGAAEEISRLAGNADRNSLRKRMSLMSLAFPTGMGSHFMLFASSRGCIDLPEYLIRRQPQVNR